MKYLDLFLKQYRISLFFFDEIKISGIILFLRHCDFPTFLLLLSRGADEI